MTPFLAGMVMFNTLALAGTACILYTLFASSKAQPNPTPQNPNALQNGQNSPPNETELSTLVEFILHTPMLGNFHPYLMHPSNHSSFINSPFNLNWPTKVVIHGFLNNAKEGFVQIIRDAYLRAGNVNVISVDWSALSSIDYIRAMNAADSAAYSVASFSMWLMKEGVKPADIHFVGHSLGAHVSGMAGHRVDRPKIGRITGLDPAGPGFHDMPMEYRLDPSDALLVDVIHTHMNVLALDEPLGHIDFYPNGGKSQPGCPDPRESFWNLGGSVLCNHGRAFWLFAESIYNKKAFKSKKCATLREAHTSSCTMDSDVYMGQADTYEPGVYYVKTADAPPFSL